MFGKHNVFIIIVTIFFCTLLLSSSLFTFAQTSNEEQETPTAIDWWEKVFIPLFRSSIFYYPFGK